jgi:DNA-binding transcriptional LysR family regulator
MQPTARAAQMADGVRAALQALSASLESSAPFVPARSRQSFVFAATDFTAFAVLPQLVAALERQAPQLRIKVVHSSHSESLQDLASGRVHFALGFSDEHSAGEPVPGLQSLQCFSDGYVVAARQGHARIGAQMSLPAYLAERHVAVLPWSGVGSVIDASLLKQGLRRDVAVQLPSMLAAPFIVAHSDLLLTLPRRAAQQLARMLPVTLHPAPFETPAYTLQVFFHARHADGPAHRWMRELMRSVLVQE